MPSAAKEEEGQRGGRPRARAKERDFSQRRLLPACNPSAVDRKVIIATVHTATANAVAVYLVVAVGSRLFVIYLL